MPMKMQFITELFVKLQADKKKFFNLIFLLIVIFYAKRSISNVSQTTRWEIIQMKILLSKHEKMSFFPVNLLTTAGLYIVILLIIQD